MLHPKTYQTPNAIDAGEAPPTRPARRTDRTDSSSMPSVEDVRLNAKRLLSLASDHGPNRLSSSSSFRLPRQVRDGFVEETNDHGLIDITDQTPTYQHRENHYDDDQDGEYDSRHHDIDRHDADDRTSEEEGTYEHRYPTILRGHGSLPSVEEAQLYASRYIKSTRDVSPESAERATLSTLPLHNMDTNGFSKPVFSSKSKTIPLITPSRTQELQRRRLRRCIWGMLAVAILAIVIAAIVVLASYKPPGTSAASSTTITATGTTVLGGTSQRLADTLEFLTRRTISNRENLNDWTKPQYDAAVWIADHDALAYPVPTLNQIHDDQYIDFVQRYVMALFYYSLNGPAWENQNLFLDKEHVCGWYSTINLDDGEVVAVGVSCDSAGEVAELLLPRNKMDGTLPTELAHLTKLHFVDLNRNSIHGSIPDEFSDLERMQFFDLRYNAITGTIPEWIGTWTNLGELALTSNTMTGSLPTTMSSLQKLKTLSLAHNQFDSTLAPIASLTNLEYLYLENNQFEGDINDDFLKGMSRLVQVDVSTNQLSAQNLPLHLFQYESLKILDLSDNIIMGTLPSDIVDNTALQYLSLSDNSITGTIPARINALKALNHLDLTGNGLTGNIPESLSTMQALTYIFLSENGFIKGPIPDFFSGMGNLRELSLSSTQRNGTLPSNWLGDLKNLVLFDVSYNEMTGTIPANMWNHQNLEFLLLNRNDFSGSLPPGIDSTNLNLLLIDKNRITGDLTDACDLQIDFIVVDCDEVTCACCKCCSDSEPSCNDDLLHSNQDFSWEFNYTRVSYAFSPSILFDEPSQQSSGSH